MFLFRLDFLCDGHTILTAEYLCHPCCPVAHKGGVIHFSVQADAIGNDVDVHIVGVLVRYCHPLRLASPMRIAKFDARLRTDARLNLFSSCGAMPISIRRNLFLQRVL